MKRNEAEREEARQRLLQWLKPGDTVYTILNHVSRSGMSRDISVVLLEADKDGNISHLHPNDAVSKVLGVRRAKHGDGVVMGGCGMDMGFHLVYSLSRSLWPDGFECAGEGKCRANDHTNGDRNYQPHHHNDGGYALKHQWLS